jgi:hypothetical protein
VSVERDAVLEVADHDQQQPTRSQRVLGQHRQ